MKKTLGLLCAPLVLSSWLWSVENQSVVSSTRFIGFEVGASEVQGETLFDPSKSGTDVSYGVRIGAQEGVWRTTLLFNYYDNSDDDLNVETLLLTADYFFLQNESSVQPYLGLNVGYANYESTGVDDSGFVYGGQIGVAFALSSSFNLDLSYRYSLSQMDVMDHDGGVMLSFDYKF